MHPFQALNRYWRLLAHYLRPQWARMVLLAVILCGGISMQVVTPLLASRFIDQAAELGVKFYVCQPSLDLNNIRYEELMDGVEMIGGAAFNDMALDADAVISF